MTNSWNWDNASLDLFEQSHDKTNKMACVPSEDSEQPGHPPSPIRVFAIRIKKAWVLSYPLSTQRRLWSDLADAHAHLSLRRAHSHFVGFVMRPRICAVWLWCSVIFSNFCLGGGSRWGSSGVQLNATLPLVQIISFFSWWIGSVGGGGAHWSYRTPQHLKWICFRRGAGLLDIAMICCDAAVRYDV